MVMENYLQGVAILTSVNLATTNVYIDFTRSLNTGSLLHPHVPLPLTDNTHTASPLLPACLPTTAAAAAAAA